MAVEILKEVVEIVVNDNGDALTLARERTVKLVWERFGVVHSQLTSNQAIGIT